jgi:hypothetical protein
MTAATASWPGSRVLAGWWPSLGRWQPRSLWLHLLLLHRVEALVRLSRGAPLDRLNQLLLEALATAQANPTADQLAPQLGLEASLVGRLLAELESAGLARKEAPPGEPWGDAWGPTDAGREVLSGRRDPATLQERRIFYFAEGDARHPGARFLPLDNPSSAPWPEGAPLGGPLGGPFDVRVLADCVARPAEWKREHDFPPEVSGVADVPTWKGVVIDRPEQLLLLCLRTEAEDLLGFAVQPGAWQVQAERPVLRMGPAWREALPELAEEPDTEAWRAAWRAWGQPRSLPAGELEACHLERVETRLRVRAPRPLMERLRATRSDAVKGEAWLLAGGDRTRTAALIELVEE